MIVFSLYCRYNGVYLVSYNLCSVLTTLWYEIFVFTINSLVAFLDCKHLKSIVGYARTRFSSPRNTILHVTSKYLGQSKNANQLLQQLSTHIGSIGAIKVTSVVVTKRTIAARVCLDKASQEYYFNDMEGFSGNKPAGMIWSVELVHTV